MSSVGSPTDVSSIIMDTMPACGMPAAPVHVTVTIKLNRRNSDDNMMKKNNPELYGNWSYVKCLLSIPEDNNLS